MNHEVALFDDVGAFVAATWAWLSQHEAENGLLMGLLATHSREPPRSAPLMGRVTSGGETVFVALQGEHHLIISRGPDQAIEALVARLCALGIEVSGVVGPAGAAEHFARSWARERGRRALLAVDQRIYQLTQVSWPAPVSGGMRPIVPADLDLVAVWAQSFDVEAVPADERRTLEEACRRMAARISEGNLFGWEVSGQLVAMAGLARPTDRFISVNSVYTPPANRRHGYASALVAAVSQEGLGRGKTACLLYTDLANPTSNAIYQRIGYRPVCDSRVYLLRPL